LGLLDKFRIDKFIVQALQASTLETSDAAQALSRLKASSDVAVPKLFTRLAATDESSAGRIRDVLNRLVSPTTIAHFFPGLSFGAFRS